MSSGKVHTKACIALASGFILAGGIPEATGALIGILISCDLDVDAGNTSDTYIRNRFGRTVEMGWDGLWYFYRRSLKHGGELSHFPIISTLGRIAYLFFFTIVIPYLVLMLFLPGAWDMQTELGWWWGKIWEHWRLIVGLMGADLIHYFLDILTTEHKK